MASTIYRISEEILKALSGGNISSASNISLNEIKISVGQVVNQLLKTEHTTYNFTFDNDGNFTSPVSISAPSIIGSITGNADTASKWATPRKIDLVANYMTGTVTLDGSQDVVMTATLNTQTNLVTINGTANEIAVTDTGLAMYYAESLKVSAKTNFFTENKSVTTSVTAEYSS